MYVSNLRSFIEGMGGRLTISAHFSEGDVQITNFADVEPLSTQGSLRRPLDWQEKGAARKDDALAKGYLQGRYGAVPFVRENLLEGNLFYGKG